MEAAGTSRPPDYITADPLLVNLKEETPGVILSNVDLVTPVYSLVPIIKLEPEPENILEKVVNSEILNTNFSGSEGNFSDTNEIEFKKGFIETVSSKSVSEELSSYSITEKLVLDLIAHTEVLNVSFEKIPKLHIGENEHSSPEAASSKTYACQLEASLSTPKYHKSSDMSELYNGIFESVLDKELKIRETDNIKKKPSRIDDVISDSSGFNAEMIVGNCDAPLITPAFETIVADCDMPLLRDKNNLSSLIPEEFEPPVKQKTGRQSVNSQKISPRPTGLIKKRCKAKQSKKEVKRQLVTRANAKIKENKQTSKVCIDSVHILDFPARKERITRSSSRWKDIGPSFESPSENTNIPNLFDASLDQAVLMRSPENSLKHIKEPPKMIRSILKQALERNINKPIKNNGFEKISLEANLISPIQVRDDCNTSSVNKEKISSSLKDVSSAIVVNIDQVEETSLSAEAVGCDDAAQNIAAAESPAPFVDNKETSSVVVAKPSHSSKKQKKEKKSSESLLTPGGYPKPILVSNKEWQQTPERFIHRQLKLDGLKKSYRKHTFFANDELTVQTVTVFSNSKNGKAALYKEKLYFVKDKGWVCERCEQIFRKAHHLQDHKKSCLRDGIICNRCPRLFSSLGEFRAHLPYCQKPVHKCPKCPRIFYMLCRYEYHYSLYHEQEYTCIDCSPPRTFSDKIVLRRHVNNRHLKPNVTCKACGQVLRRYSIKQHMRGHDRKKLVCLHCGLHFTAERSLRTHWKTHNDTGNPAALMCSCCGKFFELKTELVKHLKEHTSERSFICENCGKGFFSLKNLLTHLVSHKEKQFVCPKCNRGFALRHQLKAHLGTIACGENALPSTRNKKSLVKTDKKKSRSVSKKTYFCANCEEGFVSKRLLVTHLSTELCCENTSGTKSMKNAKKKTGKGNSKRNLLNKTQFICANCNKRFNHKHRLVAHLSGAPCSSDAIMASKNVVKTSKDNVEKLSRGPNEQFITAYENFVQKRQLAADCDSVMSSKDVRSSEGTHEVAVERKKKNKEKLIPISKNQLSCENCGQSFGRKCQLAAHLGTGPCSNSASSSLKKARFAPKTTTEKKSRSTSGNQFFCANCSRDFVLKRQLVAHVCNSASNDDVLSALKQTKKLVRKTEEAEKELKPELSNKLLVCESCSQGFVNKHQLDDHLCPAAGCSYALSPSTEAKKAVERKERKKKKLRSVPEKQSVRIRDLVLKQKLSRPFRSAALSFSESPEKLKGVKKH